MILQGHVLDRLRELPDDSVDSIVTDPPYELGFMGKSWDASGIAYSVEMWREAFRVLKPGGHLLSFGGSRTYHRMACAIEDAGFEIRDQIMWVYGSGFPKSLDISKAIDKAAGAEREVLSETFKGERAGRRSGIQGQVVPRTDKETAPATEEAKQWEGWGTALKPAHEPICMARKPFKGTVAANVLEHGTGALNIDGCRVEGRESNESGWSKTGSKASENRAMSGANYDREPKDEAGLGRWPANFIHDGSEEVTALFPCDMAQPRNPREPSGEGGGIWAPSTGQPVRGDVGDSGSAARFFYCAKASRAERDLGLDGLPRTKGGSMNMRTDAHAERVGTAIAPVQNSHPTVKPIALMRYLCRMVTPPGGTVLDLFAGSGTTGCAAKMEGFDFILIEQSAEYVAIIEKRLSGVTPGFRFAEAS